MRLLARALKGALLGLAVSLLGACTNGAAPPGRSAQAVGVSLLDCGSGWTPSRTGTFHLTFTNTDVQNGEVRIVGTGGTSSPRGAVFADVEPLAARSRTHLDIALGPGNYAVQCLFEASSAINGPALHLAGPEPSHAAHGVTAVTLDDLAGPIRQYQSWVRSQLPALARDSRALRAALVAGDRPAAKAAWFAGHNRYERLGAAYGAFGDLDGAINGLPNGLPGGTRDPGWTGFHALEFGLWAGTSTQHLLPLAGRLVADVGRLDALMAASPTVNPNEPEIKNAPGAIDPLTFSIRAHEISENALQVSLTGEDDFGAHASLAAVAANLDGTVRVLDIVGPLLVGRIDRAPIDSTIAAARSALASAGLGAVSALPQRTRERIDATIAQLTELLAPVAVVLEPRRAS